MDTKFIIGMRDSFFEELFKIAKRDKNVVIVSADNGAPALDKFAYELKNQFYTVGIAEQQMIGMAAGLALEGKKVYTYAIAPFITTRVYEQQKIDICAHNLPIVSLGVGAGYAYDIMGPTHHTVEDISIMRALPGMKIYSPTDSVCSKALARITYKDKSPQYVRFDRAGIPQIYDDKFSDFSKGFVNLKEGKDVCIVSTGIMTHNALEASLKLEKVGIDAGVLDLFRVKPINLQMLLKSIGKVKGIITAEEHLLSGGMGSILAELFIDNRITTPLLRIGQDDRFVFELGGREVIWKKYGLDAGGIVKKIVKFYKELEAIGDRR